MVVYAINGRGDEGNWDIELYSSLEKAKNVFNNYVYMFEDMFEVKCYTENDDYAEYDAGSHYDRWWIEEIEVK